MIHRRACHVLLFKRARVFHNHGRWEYKMNIPTSANIENSNKGRE